MKDPDPRRPVPSRLDASAALAALAESRRYRGLDDAYMAVIAHTPFPGSALDLAERELERTMA